MKKDFTDLQQNCCSLRIEVTKSILEPKSRYNKRKIKSSFCKGTDLQRWFIGPTGFVETN